MRKTSSTDESDTKEVRKCIHQGERVEDWNCLDKADHPTDRAAVEAANSIQHLRRIGEEQLDQAGSNAGRSSSATTGSQSTPSASSSSTAPCSGTAGCTEAPSLGSPGLVR